MNTKTTKFLAVLAVLAMAFAGIAIIAPADQSDATAAGYMSDGTVATTTEIPATLANGGIYIATADTAVTAVSGVDCTIYVVSGKTLTITGATSGGAITVYAASSDSTAGSSTTKILKNNDTDDSKVVATASVDDSSLKITATFGAAGTEASEGKAGTASSFTVSGTVTNLEFTATSGTYIKGNICTVDSYVTTTTAPTYANFVCGYYFANETTDYTMYSRSYSATITANATADEITIMNASSLIVKSASEESGKQVTFTLTGIVGDSDNQIVITGGANGSTAPNIGSTSNETSDAGKIEISTDNTGATVVTVDNTNVNFGSKKTIVVNENVNLTTSASGGTTFGGIMELYGTLTTGNTNKLLGTPIIKVDPSATYTPGTSDVVKVAPINATDYSGIEGVWDCPIENKTLEGNVSVPLGATLTVNGDLLLNGKNIIVDGDHVISPNARVYDCHATPGKIILAKGAELVQNGMVGGVNGVGIYAYGTGTGSDTANVKEKYVSGLGVEATGTDAMTISGSIQAIKATGSEITVYGPANTGTSNVTIGDLTVGSNVKLKLTYNSKYNVETGSDIAIYGTIESTDNTQNGVTIILGNNTTLKMNGVSSDKVIFSAATGKVDPEATSTFYSNSNVTGYELSVSRNQVSSTTYQRMYISGNVTLIAGQTAGEVTMTGELYVASGVELSLPSGLAITGGYVNVHGKITAVGNVSTNNTMISAASYQVTNSGVITAYFTSVSEAISNLTTADNKSVRIILDSFNDSFEVPAGCTVSLYKYDFDPTVSYITVSGNIVVKTDGILTGSNIKVEGSLTVEPRANCVTPSAYDVKGTLSDGSTRYSGLVYAVKNAAYGDVIDVTSSSITSDLTIPEGVTVNVKTALTTTKNITVSDEAQLNLKNNATLTAASTSKIVVNGLLDASKGTYSGNGAKVSATGTAKFTEGTTVNAVGAYFTDDYLYVTTLAGAALLAADTETVIHIAGTYAETGTVTCKNNVVIDADSTFTVSDLTMIGASVSTAAETSVLNGNVSLATGDGLGFAKVKLSKYSGAGSALASVKTTSGMGVDSYKATINALNNAVTVLDGTLNLTAAAIAVDAESVITVGDDAVLVIPAGATLTATEATAKFVVDGELDVVGTLNLTGSKAYVNGTLDVKYNKSSEYGTANVSKLDLQGTLDIETGAVFNLTGTITSGKPAIGAVPAINGIVMTNSADAEKHYILAFAGSDMSGLIMDPDALGASQAVKTVFYINGAEYMTVYAGTSNVPNVSEVVGGLAFDIEGLDKAELAKLKTIGGWGLTENHAIGADQKLSAEISAAKITMTVSWASGLSIYIDNVRINDGKDYQITVGNHKVSAKVDPGYACDDMSITFNGVPLTAAGLNLTVDDDGAILAVNGDVYEPAPTPEEKSDWTINTILLCILVVLIAIMAVIVALRLNRG